MAMTKQRPVTFTKENFNVTKDTTVDGVVAETCGFYPCLKRYHAQVSKGVLSEKVISSIIANRISYNEGGEGFRLKTDPNYFSQGNCTAMGEPCYLDGKVYTMGNISKGRTQTRAGLFGMGGRWVNCQRPNRLLVPLLEGLRRRYRDLTCRRLHGS